MSPKSSTLFAFFPNSISIFWSSAIAKALGQNDTFVFLGSLQQMVFASRKVFCNVPQTVLYIGLTVSCGFFGQWLLLQKGSVEGSANCALHLSPSLLVGSKLRDLLTCLTHTNPVRRKLPIMSLLLGYSLGLFFGGSLRSPIALQNRTVIVWPGKRWRWAKRSELPTLCDGSVMCPAGNPAGAIIIALHQR